MDYVEMNKCGSCKYYSYEGKYSKGYCSWYKAYYYADDSCDHWQEGNVSSSGGCFLTTACCEYKGLADDCYELTSMRFLRDKYMKNYDFGRELVELYYQKAPCIVKKINLMSNKNSIYEDVYSKIQNIVMLIDKKQYDEAIGKYVNLMFWIEKFI